MATLYLHVGMHKTGTTAIQNHCHEHRARLRRAGLAYMDASRPNHSALMTAAFDISGYVALRLPRNGGESASVTSEKAQASVLRFFRACADADVDALVSGEAMSTFSREGIARMREAAASFDTVTILALVRPPRAFVDSLFMELINGGHDLELVCRWPLTPGYRVRFEPYLDAFGASNVRFRIFAPGRLEKGCPFQTLLAMMDGDWRDFGEDRAARVNESLSFPAAKLVAACGRHRGRYEADDPSWFRRNVISLLANVEGPPTRLPGAMMELVERRMADDVAWMEGVLGEPLTPHDTDAAVARPAAEEWATFSADEAAAVTLGMAAERLDRHRRNREAAAARQR